ncbi:MAG TPA: transcriptional regulator [Anaerolineales bacterium]|nr:transcriptional regulator [Anaerolineales bacterium]
MSDEIKDITTFDRLIHEPARLAIMAVLSACENADFAYLLNATGLSKGNLSAHLSKLEEGGYVAVTKGFKGKYPNTTCALTATGRKAFSAYRKQYLALAQHLEK